MRFARLASHCLQLIILISMSTAATAEKLTIERLFAAPDLSGASLRSPHISPDGLTLYFSSDRPGGCGNYDIYMSTRTHLTGKDKK